MAEKDRARVCHSRRVGYDVPTEHPAQSSVRLVSSMSTSVAGSANGRSLNWIALTKLKTDVVAAIPKPRERPAVTTSPGERRSARST
jgi:hypothetical protein